MERHIGLWKKERSDKPAVAELIIDGNSLEFFSRDYGHVFPCAFVGTDNDHKYKIFTNGSGGYGKHRTLENVGSYKAVYVLQQDCKFKEGLVIEGITKASFIIPELIDWLELNTIDWGATDEGELLAIETKHPEIVLKARNPRVEIYYESKSSLYDGSVDDRTTFIIKNQPRIRISYEQSIDVVQVQNDIRALMQFFGLMIGYITDALDIRLDIEGQELKSWLYINEDFSYNLRTINAMDRPRTKLKSLEDNIKTYFENWYLFFNDDKFEMIRRMYFSGNNKKDIWAEDILVQYVRILEGYHLRVTEEEQKVSNIEKDIKKMIFTDEGQTLFIPIFEKADWKFNSSHAKRVASWIASGFLERIGLSERLKQLDNQYFNIIAENAQDIDDLNKEVKTSEEEKGQNNVVEDYYRKIVATRNFYSHYKANRDNVLNFTQMCNTINVLKGLIIMILYTHMGMTNENARKIIIWDTELNFQTMCLRKDTERHDNI